MKSLTSWLLFMMLVMFWMFRIIITLSVQYGGDFAGFVTFDNTKEIAMLFISLVCFALIVKRSLLGAVIYIVGYGYYFGNYIYEVAMPSLMSAEVTDVTLVQNILICVIGILLGILTFFDIVFENRRSTNHRDIKTGWFFEKGKHERELDERADKNQYRTL